MKFYESGDSSKPVIFLFPGTCCLYSSFDHILDRLHSYFYTVTVSYDGFDPNEKIEFYSMEDECEKIEQEIKKKYDGRIKAAYGCSLGGSFVSLLIQRKRIHIDHGIIGSSDMDEAGCLVAKIKSSMVVPFMYKMIHTGALPKFMQKKLNKTDEVKKELKNLEYDFSKADKDKAMNYGVIARTIVLDRMVEQYLEKNVNTIVINIACGLDTRCYRMEGKYLRWYNVDLPETMKIRKRFLTETGPIYQIAKSAMDDSYIDDIDYHGENVLVIIEGLTMYLCEKDIRKMFFIIEKSFQEVTVMVETMSPFVVNHVKEKSIEGSNAKFTWGVKNGTELQRIVPGFSVQQEVSLVEGMKKLMPIYHVIGKISIVRNISNKIIVMEKHG